MGSFDKKSTPHFSNHVKMTAEEAEVYKNSEGVKYIEQLSEAATTEMTKLIPGATEIEFYKTMCTYISIETAKIYEELIVLRKFKADTESKGE